MPTIQQQLGHSYKVITAINQAIDKKLIHFEDLGKTIKVHTYAALWSDDDKKKNTFFKNCYLYVSLKMKKHTLDDLPQNFKLEFYSRETGEHIGNYIPKSI